MRVEPIIAVQLLVFLGLTWLVYRLLARRVRVAGMRCWQACLIFVSWLAVAPYGLLKLFVPLANRLFLIYPALQSGAWDVGLAFALWLGMALAYALGVIVGVWGIRNLIRMNAGREHEGVC